MVEYLVPESQLTEIISYIVDKSALVGQGPCSEEIRLEMTDLLRRQLSRGLEELLAAGLNQNQAELLGELKLRGASRTEIQKMLLHFIPDLGEQITQALARFIAQYVPSDQVINNDAHRIANVWE